MKPLKQNMKKPRGAALDKARDELRVWALRYCAEAKSKLSAVADRLFEMDEKDLGDSARRVKRDVERLQGRIENMNVVIPRGRQPEPEEESPA